MKYSTAENGTYRVWVFVNSAGTEYFLSATDGFRSPSAQAEDNAVLATFRPDDATPGCA